MSHYRKQLIFTYESLDGAENAYKKLLNKTKALKFHGQYNDQEFAKWDKLFKECLEDDLNTANAMTILYDLLKSDVDDATKYHLIYNWDKVFSLELIKDVDDNEEQDEEILKQIEKRNIAKQNKDYATADKIRDELLSKGIVLKDTPNGTIYERK